VILRAAALVLRGLLDTLDANRAGKVCWEGVMTEREIQEVEREIDQLFRGFHNGMNDPDLRRRAKAQAGGSSLELLSGNYDDAYQRIHAGSYPKIRDIPAVISYAPPLAPHAKVPSGTPGVISLAGRIAIVLTFIMSALFGLMNADASVAIIASKLLQLPVFLQDAAALMEAKSGLRLATALVILCAALESAAAVLIVMGVFIRPASVVLLIFAAAGIYGSSQWAFQNGMQPEQIIRVLNELSIIGGLLILFSRIRPRTIP
jgi:uncharacterized membrane protein YphA (DoxX/SURF4 family)